MEEFSRSREDNDLFADDFEPITEAIVIEEGAEKEPKSRTEETPRGSRGNQSHAGRKARGGGGQANDLPPRGGKNGLSASRFAATATTDVRDAPVEQAKDTPSADPTPEASASLIKAPYQGAQAVRGDRSATGGPAVKKLSEQELSEKMAKMKVLNAQKAEKFRLSEADSAAFAKKEKEDQKKRAEEKKNHRAMDIERAKNRERKLKAQGGREWDLAKQDSDLIDRTKGRSSEYVRGGFGGVARGAANGLANSHFNQNSNTAFNEQDYMYREPSRGRGRGGRGSHRGGKIGTNGTALGPEDFPSLPSNDAGSSHQEPKAQVEPKAIQPTSVQTKLQDSTGNKLVETPQSVDLGLSEERPQSSWAEEVSSMAENT